MQRRFFHTLIVALLLAPACGFAADTLHAPGATSQSLTISGLVQKPTSIKASELREYPADQLVELQLKNRDGSISQVKGVRVRTLLERAEIVSRDHNTVKKLVIIASATDNYRAVFSWSELFNTDVGEDVLVIFERNGSPLDDGEGAFALISAKDLRPGPRHVKWLKLLEVRQIAD